MFIYLFYLKNPINVNKCRFWILNVEKINMFDNLCVSYNYIYYITSFGTWNKFNYDYFIEHK